MEKVPEATVFGSKLSASYDSTDGGPWLIMRKEENLKKDRNNNCYSTLHSCQMINKARSRKSFHPLIRWGWNVTHLNVRCCFLSQAVCLSDSNAKETDLRMIVRRLGSQATELEVHLWERGLQEMIDVFRTALAILLEYSLVGRKTVLTHWISFRADKFSGFCGN